MILMENKMNTKKYYKVFFFDEETKTISAQGHKINPTNASRQRRSFNWQ